MYLVVGAVLLAAYLPPRLTVSVGRLNDVTDSLVQAIRRHIQVRDVDIIDVPIIDHEWKMRWYYIPLKGKFHCEGGSLESLSSIRRAGDTRMKIQSNGITVYANLTLKLLHVHFKSCKVYLHGFGSMWSPMDVDVDSNAIEARVTVTTGSQTCHSELDYMKVTRLGHISIVTGSGLFHRIQGEIYTSVTNSMHGSIINVTTRVLTRSVRTAVAGSDICAKYFTDD